jgi:tetratricopeptide (TPR) repeat protein
VPRRRTLLRAAGAALAVGAVGLVVWYALAPPVPSVRLDAGADPALVEAIAAARWRVRRAPWSDGPRGRLAMLLQAHSFNGEAAGCYAAAERLNPDEPRWPHLHSFVAAADPPTALALSRRAAELTANRPGAPDAPALHWADTCLEQDRLDEADGAYRGLLQRRADHPRARLGLARLSLRRGRTDQALEHLRLCAASPSTRKAAHILLAETQRRRGDGPAAADAAGRAAALPADEPWPDPWADEIAAVRVGRQARLARLRDLRARGRLREAGDLARQTIEEYPDVGWLDVGRARLAARQWAEAEEALRQTLCLDPSSVEAHFALGQALLGQHKYEPAAASFRRVVELEPTHAGAYRGLARCAAATGHPAEAVRLQQRALNFQPHDADLRRELGELLAAMPLP